MERFRIEGPSAVFVPPLTNFGRNAPDACAVQQLA